MGGAPPPQHRPSGFLCVKGGEGPRPPLRPPLLGHSPFPGSDLELVVRESRALADACRLLGRSDRVPHRPPKLGASARARGAPLPRHPHPRDPGGRHFRAGRGRARAADSPRRPRAVRAGAAGSPRRVTARAGASREASPTWGGAGAGRQGGESEGGPGGTGSGAATSPGRTTHRPKPPSPSTRCEPVVRPGPGTPPIPARHWCWGVGSGSGGGSGGGGASSRFRWRALPGRTRRGGPTTSCSSRRRGRQGPCAPRTPAAHVPAAPLGGWVSGWRVPLGKRPDPELGVPCLSGPSALC